jgi:predicted small metal-binding protein
MANFSIVCECGYVVEGETEDEIVLNTQRHAREAHAMELTRDQVLAMLQPAPGA